MLMDLFKVNIHDILGQKDPNEDLKAEMEQMKIQIMNRGEEVRSVNSKIDYVDEEHKQENRKLKTKVAKQDEEIKTLKEGTIKENQELRATVTKLQAENKELKEGLIKENKELKAKITKQDEENQKLQAEIKALKSTITK